jgi:GMP synthase (glutamine-hydrolysing)
MSASVLVLQHAAPEHPGAIGAALRARGVPVEVVHTHAGEEVPASIEGRQGLVVMGGPMGVYEEASYPHLTAEIRLIRAALESGIPVLGVCLGSQLLAASLGARVAPGNREIGWYPIELSEHAGRGPLWAGIESPLTPFHWHGDAFELPDGALPLARSERTACQAFSFGGRAHGFLFHLEVDARMVREMTEAFARELEDTGVDRDELLAQAARFLPALRETADVVFGRWADLLNG